MAKRFKKEYCNPKFDWKLKKRKPATSVRRVACCLSTDENGQSAKRIKKQQSILKDAAIKFNSPSDRFSSSNDQEATIQKGAHYRVESNACCFDRLRMPARQ